METSYSHGTSETPLLGETIGAALERVTRAFGDREALVSRHQRIRYTYAQLDDRVDALARGLMAAGIEPGDRVGICAGGYCRIVGRIKDMVIRGGENIYPREIEEQLFSHPDVVEAQVVGVPDEAYAGSALGGSPT